jgi:hypothetical protein
MPAAQALRQAAATAALTAGAAAALDVVAARGALVRGAGGSRTRFARGFGASFTIFFGFGFAFGGVIKTTAGFGARGSSRTAIDCGGPAFSGSALVICGPGVASGGVSDGGAMSTGESSIIIAARGDPARLVARTCKSQNTIIPCTRTTTDAAKIHRLSESLSAAGSIVAMVMA